MAMENLLEAATNFNSSEEEEEGDGGVIVVDTEENLKRAISILSKYKNVTFDAEGVDLSRTGPLTVVILQGITKNARNMINSCIYVVDVTTLGGDVVFSKHPRKSLRLLLEDSSVTKVTFDCRTDSDALYHQFGVTLAGTLDLQVLDQAVRIHQGEVPPERMDYFKVGGNVPYVPYLSSMEKVITRYDLGSTMMKLKAISPHVAHKDVWMERPLSKTSIQYAANDANIIRFLWEKMTAIQVSTLLMDRVVIHSKRYESMFRERVNGVVFVRDREFVMEEHAIISESELPKDHPRNPRETSSYTVQRWNQAVKALKLGLPTAYNDVIFILQHDDWYTDSGMREIRRLASTYPFSCKQKQKIAQPPQLKRQEEDYWDENYYGDY